MICECGASVHFFIMGRCKGCFGKPRKRTEYHRKYQQEKRLATKEKRDKFNEYQRNYKRRIKAEKKEWMRVYLPLRYLLEL